MLILLYTGGKPNEVRSSKRAESYGQRKKKGDVMSQVKFKLFEPNILTSVLTTDSVLEMDLKLGDEIHLLVKAIHVIPVKE